MENDLDEKLTKCIRCGFCLDACPTFRLTGQETLSPRGRIYLVRSWRDGVIPFDKNVIHALDSCLGCRACETACPSGVEYGSILEMARTHIEEDHLRSAPQTFARGQLLAMLTSPGRMALALKAGGMLSGITGNKMPGFAAKLLSGSSDSAIPMPAVSGSVKVHNLPERSAPMGEKRATVGILAGCVMRVLFGETNAATVRVLQQNGCEVIAPKAAGCCGALHLHSGYHEGGLERARALIDAFAPYLDELDAIILNSAGCGSTMKEYGALLANDTQYREKAKAFAAKVKDITEYLDTIGLVAPKKAAERNRFLSRRLPSGARAADSVAASQNLKADSRPEPCEMDEADTCCGSAGTYNITQPEMARKLLDRKLAHIRETGATIIATGNPGCLAWIAQGAQEADLKLRICHPVELLDEAY